MASSASIEKIKAIQKGLGLQNISGQWNNVVDIEFSSLLENLISWKKKFGENISIPNWILNTSEGRYPELKFRGNLNQALELVENKEKYYKEFLRLKEPSAEQRDNFVYTLFLLYIQKILNQKTTGVLSDELYKKYTNSTTSTGLKDIIKDLSSNDQFKKLDLIKNKLGVTGNLWDYETLFNLNKKINEVCQQEGFVKNINGVNFCDTTIDVIDGLVQFKDDNEQTVGKEAVSFDSGNKFFNKTTAYRNKGVGESMSMSNNKNVRNAGVRAAQLAEIAIISKVAARKERAKVNLIKMAVAANPVTIGAAIAGAAGALATAYLAYRNYQVVNKDDFIKYMEETSEKLNRNDSTIPLAYNNDFTLSRDHFLYIYNTANKTKYNTLYDLIGVVDQENQPERGEGFDDYDFKPLIEEYKKACDRIKQSVNVAAAQPSNVTPTVTPTVSGSGLVRNKAVSIDEIIRLLRSVGQNPSNTWDKQTNTAFLDACRNYRDLIDIDIVIPDDILWENIASSLGDFEPNMNGAKKMLEKLYEKRMKVQTTQQATTLPPENTPAIPEEETNLVSDLTKIFDKILNGSLKIDQAGLDFQRDTMVFKGVIRGLGGANKAAQYCKQKITFDQKEKTSISSLATENSSEKRKKIQVSGFIKILREFEELRELGREGRGKEHRGFTEDQIAASVGRLVREKIVSASSISKAIEMRKLAARKRLGL